MSQTIKVLCPQCGHMAWHTVEPEVIQPEYTTTDAQADAAVLVALGDYLHVADIKQAIHARLHAFYVGGQDDKR